jgi:hypothetical protein
MNARGRAPKWTPPPGSEFARQLADLMVWGVQRGFGLLGKPVNILLTSSGLGYTSPVSRTLPATIHVNPKVLTQERGPDLLRGLILHEIGHHYAHFSDPDFSKVDLKCRLDGLFPLLNLMMDEHMERRLRALDAEWGEYLDALVASAFKGKPLQVLIEDYLALMQLVSPQEAVRAIDKGEVPGEILSWESGYELEGDGPDWVTGSELIDLITEILTEAAPDNELPRLLIEALNRLQVQAASEWIRRGPPGILLKILDHEVFSEGGRSHISAAQIHISDLLEPRSAEIGHPGRYLERVRRTIKPLLKDFPKLERFAVELEDVLHSKYFWNKQRSMLYMMRRNRDFKGAFLAAGTMSNRDLKALLGEDFFEPGLILRAKLEEWQPRCCTSPEHPLKISIPWMAVLRSNSVSDEVRFMITLRLGLGKEGIAGREPVQAALAAVPPSLRKKNMAELEQITREVAACLGFPPPESRKNRQETSPTERCGDIVRRSLDQHQDELTRPLDAEEEKVAKEPLRQAVEEANERIDQWLRSGVDPGHSGEKQQEQKREGKRSRGWKAINGEGGGPGAKGRSRGSLDSDLLNIAAELDFPIIEGLGLPPSDPKLYAQLVAPVQSSIRSLRRFLLSLGQAEQESFGMRQGRRLDPARVRRLAVLNDPAVAVGHFIQPGADLFLGVCVDCSGSMVLDDRMDKALTFAALLMEAARKLEGVDCRVRGFEDELIWDAGSPGSTRLAGLKPGGGNNDAGALLAMARLALRSSRKHRLLVMISDGFPTECSLDSLRNLVQVLNKRYGIVSAQVAVAPMEPERVAFSDFTDLTEHSIPLSVRLFGRMVQRLLMRQVR